MISRLDLDFIGPLGMPQTKEEKLTSYGIFIGAPERLVSLGSAGLPNSSVVVAATTEKTALDKVAALKSHHHGYLVTSKQYQGTIAYLSNRDLSFIPFIWAKDVKSNVEDPIDVGSDEASRSLTSLIFHPAFNFANISKSDGKNDTSSQV